MEDRKSWAIKDDGMLNDLVSLMGLSDAEINAMTTAKEQAKTLAPDMVSGFYDRLLNYEPTAEYIEGKVEHLRSTLENWFMELFSGTYDQAYVDRRLNIGKVHVRIGLPVRYPLAMIDVLIKFGEKAITDSGQSEEGIKAFRKLMALDIAIFNQAYENTQLAHLSEMVGNERLARRLLSQG